MKRRSLLKGMLAGIVLPIVPLVKLSNFEAAKKPVEFKSGSNDPEIVKINANYKNMFHNRYEFYSESKLEHYIDTYKDNNGKIIKITKTMAD